MAETIKGISVVIGAETTGLQKALSDVNKRSKDIQSELKQVEKLLKLDPSNTDLVAQKQKLLADAIANSTEKLDRLRAAQEQVDQQFASGKISEGQYRAFQREVARAEQELQRFGAQANKTEKEVKSLGDRMQDAGDKFKSTGESIKGAGETMTASITLPIVGAGAVMLKGAADAEIAGGRLRASLGLTEEESKKLGETAKKVWLDGFGENIEAANAAVISIRQNMSGVADKEMADVAKGAITIAEVFGEDVPEVTKAAGVMMKNFGIDGQKALDLITVGFQKGGNFSGELLDTLREYSPQFKSLGLSAEQSLKMLIAGAKAGAFNLDKVGDAMKEFNIRAQDGSKTTAEGFGMIGLKANDMGKAIAQGGEGAQKAFLATVTALSQMKDPLKQNQAGVALFGTQWEDVRKQVITAMSEGKKGLSDFEGATKKAEDAVNKNNPLKALVKSLRGIQEAVGPALLDIADTITKDVVPAVKSLSEWFASLSPESQKTVLAIAGIAAIIPPILVGIGMLATAVSSIIAAFTAASGAIASAGGAMAIITGPIGIAVAVISGLVAAGVLLYKNWDTIKQKASELGKWITSRFSELTTGIKSGFASAVKAASDLIAQIKNVFSEAENIGKNLVEGLWNGISSMAEWIKSKVRGFVEGIGSTIKDFFGIRSPSKLMAEYGRYIAEGLAKGMDDNKGTVAEKATVMADSITGAMDKITTGIGLTMDIAKAKFDLFFTQLGNSATESDVLKAKLEMLGTQLSAQKDKVAVLQKAYADMVNVKGIAANESRRLQLELLKEQELQSRLAQQIAATNKVQQTKASVYSGLDFSKPFQGGELVGLSAKEIVALNKSGITQNITINSPKALSPNETARQVKNASRALALEW